MDRNEVLAYLDDELGRLRAVRIMLAGGRKQPAALQLVKTTKTKKRRHLSTEAREAIRQAQIKRWAKLKRTRPAA